jgi:hypothetical protein
MTKNPFLSLLFGPTTIAVHDNGDMLRNLFQVDMVK